MINVANKRVTVMGLGLSAGGVGVAKWLLRHDAIVTVTDLKTEAQLSDSIAEVRSLGKPVEFVLGKHRVQDFSDTDLVIKNPGVPNDSQYIVAAKKAGVPIETEISVFIDQFPGHVVGVTGTKGKTTTTTLLHQMLVASGRHVILGGNLRKSPLDEVDAASENSLAVLELSSFQLESFKQHEFSPHVALWTNLLPDHLNRYADMQAYSDAKANIMLFQDQHDYFIANADQPGLKKIIGQARGHVFLFSTEKELPQGAFVRGREIILKDGEAELALGVTKKLLLRGSHNVANVLAAIAAAYILKVPQKTIQEVAETFKGVTNRLEFVRTHQGVTYINDTASTIPSSTIAALNSFEQPLICIVGGTEKNLPYQELSDALARIPKKVILFESLVGHRIVDDMQARYPEQAKERLVAPLAANMTEAVEQARALAEPGDVVLLSPGAASFGMFDNEFDRGDQFTGAVKAL